MTIRRTDVLLPAAFAVIGTVEAIVQDYDPLWATVTSYAAAGVVLCFRRPFPSLVTPGVAFIYVSAATAGVDVSEPATWLLPFPLAALAAGLYSQRVALGLATVILSLAFAFGTLSLFTDFPPDLFFGSIVFLGPWSIGLALRRAFERNQELGRQVEHARLEHEAAAASERDRIARELHDLLAHSLSVMVVQAGMAEELWKSDPERAVAALREVQRSGRTALEETSTVLRVIREGGDEMALHPRHSATDIPALIEEFTRAGLVVELELDARVGSLPLGIGLSVYRIVQEGLTNALKHARGANVEVRIQRRDGSVAVQVHSGPGDGKLTLTTPGEHGLVGVRERVAIFGGTFHAGPTRDHGFVVEATLPVVEST